MVRRMQESNNSNLFGVRLYDPYSGEYVVYWSQDKNIVREIYDTLRDSTWIRYDDLYDFVDQINPKFNKFTWEDIGFEWDYDEAFIGDGVHESEGKIDIIYELPLDTKHYAESIRRKSKRSVSESYTRVISDESGRMHYAIDSQIETIRLMMSEIKEKLDLVDNYERNLHIDGRADEDLYDVLFNNKKVLRKFSDALNDFCTETLD